MIRLNSSASMHRTNTMSTDTMRSIDEILNDDKPPSLMCSTFNGFSSLEEDDVSKYELVVSSSRPGSPVDSALSMTTQSSSNFTISMDSMLGTDTIFSPRHFVDTPVEPAICLTPVDTLTSHTASNDDLASFWTDDRKRVASLSSTSTKEDDDRSSLDNVSMVANNSDDDEVNIDVDDVLEVASVSSLRSVNPDTESDVDEDDIINFKPRCHNRLNMSVDEARAYVNKIYFPQTQLPPPGLDDDERAQHILKVARSHFTLAQIKKLEKHHRPSIEFAYNIIKPIPLRFRWDCVEPEDIPSCYTVVTDCRKKAGRDSAPRPMNAFMIWAQGTRRLINELCPRTQNAVISAVLGSIWRNETDAFREPYEKKKMKLLKFHKTEFPDYKYKPKSKDQKDREKHEQSLAKAKAKVSSSKKRKSSESDSDASLSASKTKKVKCNRSKKMSPQAPKPQTVPITPGFINICKSSPTKQTKDRLTLKILKDRHTKGAKTHRIASPSTTVTNAPTLSSQPLNRKTLVKPPTIVTTSSTIVNPTNMHHNNVVQFSMGQLSPAELGSPEVVDYFKDDSSSEHVVVDHDKPSSVYDTPANTPPVEGDEPPLYFADNFIQTQTPAASWDTDVITEPLTSAPQQNRVIQSPKPIRQQKQTSWSQSIHSAVVIKTEHSPMPLPPSAIQQAVRSTGQIKLSAVSKVPPAAARMPFISAMLGTPVRSLSHPDATAPASSMATSINNNNTKTTTVTPLIAIPLKLARGNSIISDGFAPLGSKIITLNRKDLLKSSNTPNNASRVLKSVQNKKPAISSSNSRVLTTVQSGNGFVPINSSSVFTNAQVRNVTTVTQNQKGASEKYLFRQLAPANADNMTSQPSLYRLLVKNGSVTEAGDIPTTNAIDTQNNNDVKPCVANLNTQLNDVKPIIEFLESRDIKPLPISINGVPVTESTPVSDDPFLDLGDLKDVDLDLNMPLFNDVDMFSLIQTLQNY